MKFKNPANNHVVTVTYSWLWCQLFSWLYFAKHRVWFHVWVMALVCLLTLGVAFFIYPFFARRIVREHYLSQGWEQIA